MMSKKCGVLYIAFGDLYIREAMISAESVKFHNPEINITIMADKIFECDYVDSFLKIEAEHIRAKVDYIHKSPYEHTIFLDSDTVIDHDISEMFCILDKYDFAICHDYARKRDNISKLIPEYKDIPYSFSEVNPGVIVFKNNNRVQEFFSNWRDLFYKYHDIMIYEQPTFRVALWQSDMQLYILPPEYNARSKACREKSRKLHNRFGEEHLKIRIYHLHANEKISQGQFKYKTVEKCLKVCKKKVLPI